MLLYYITDRRQFRGDADEQRRRLLDKIAEAAAAGVDFIQLRERDLPARELERLAGEALEYIRSAPLLKTHNSQLTTRLLINSRNDVAIAVGADGVHLRSDDISAADARALWRGRSSPTISVSCHTEAEVRRAAADGADFAVFAPVFEKEGRAGAGLGALRAACSRPAAAAGVEAGPSVCVPVLALGGVSVENARACPYAGAVGIAGIRLFQENEVAAVATELRAVPSPK